MQHRRLVVSSPPPSPNLCISESRSNYWEKMRCYPDGLGSPFHRHSRVPSHRRYERTMTTVTHFLTSDLSGPLKNRLRQRAAAQRAAAIALREQAF